MRKPTAKTLPPRLSKSIEKMDYTSLDRLHNYIGSIKMQKQAELLPALREQMSALATSHGVTLDDVLGGKLGASRRLRPIVKVKYRDPDNPNNTWTGRGRTPNWITEKLKDGKTDIESFRIG